MIKLQSGAILLGHGRSRREILDLDLLHDDLEASCRQADIHDTELPRDVLDLVLACVERRHDLTGAGVDELIVRLLRDAGQFSLAEAFAARREVVLQPELAAETVCPDHELVCDLLREAPEFAGRPVEQLGHEVMQQLGLLGYTVCTRGLILELARNGCRQVGGREQLAVDSPYWLVRRAEYPGLLDPGAVRLLGEKTIDISPVSRLLPAIRIDVDLLRLARGLGGCLLPELQLCPALAELTRELLHTIAHLTRIVHHRVESPADVLPPQVTAVGLSAIVKLYLGGSQQEHARLRQRLQGILRELLEPAGVKWELC